MKPITLKILLFLICCTPDIPPAHAKNSDAQKGKQEEKAPPSPEPEPVPAPPPAPEPSGAPQAFETTSALPLAFSAHALLAEGGRLYHIGGLSPAGVNDSAKAYYADIQSPGKLGSWSEASPLPKGAFLHAAAAADGYLYVMGGQQTDFSNPRFRIPQPSAAVYVSKLDASGIPGPWQATTPMPEALVSHTAAIHEGRIYIIGGWRSGVLSSRIYSAPVNPDGTLGPWSAMPSLPESLYSHATIQDGTLYALGGIGGETFAQNTVYMSRVQPGGMLEVWSETTPLPDALSDHSASVLGGRVFVTGGYDGTAAVDTVWSAPIRSDRSLSDWEAAPPLPKALYRHATASWQDAVYVSGGLSGEAPSASVYSMLLAAPKTLDATAILHPNTLNLASKGKHVTLYLEFPTFAQASASDIDPASVRIVSINGAAAELAALPKPANLGDENENGIQDLMVKFDRSELQARLSEGDARIAFAGRLKNGTEFSAEDSIWAKEAKKKTKIRRKFKHKAIAFSLEHALRVIDGEGGKLESGSRAAVDIPPGAAKGLLVSVEPEDKSDDFKVERRRKAKEGKKLLEAGPAVEYGPSGTRFDKPVTLELPYDPASLSSETEESSLQVHYWNPATGDWEALFSSVDSQNKVVRAQTSHFSLYQVLGGGAPAAAPAAAADLAFGEVYAFPNPAKRGASPVFHVEAGAADSVDIRVYDLSGRRVHEASVRSAAMIDDGTGRGPVRSFEHLWNVSGIGSGMYVYAVTAHKDGGGKIRTRGKVAVVR